FVVSTIAELVLQVVVHAEAGADGGLLAERTPGHADAWLRQELRAVGGKKRIGDAWLRRDHAAAEGVIGGAAVGFVPSGGELVTQAERERQARREADGIFRIEGTEER